MVATFDHVNPKWVSDWPDIGAANKITSADTAITDIRPAQQPKFVERAESPRSRLHACSGSRTVHFAATDEVSPFADGWMG